MKEAIAKVRVRYPEVDRMGVVHHTHYLTWFELARTELMRAAGTPYAAIEERHGLQFPVIEAHARYRRPARYDEQLEARAVLDEVAGVRVRFSYRVVRPADGALLADGFTVHASTGPDGRPRRLPRPLSERLRTWSSADDVR